MPSAAPMPGARHPSLREGNDLRDATIFTPSASPSRGAETKERALKSPPRKPKAPALRAADLATARALAALFEIPEFCPEPSCKRANACRAGGAPCLVRYRAIFRDRIDELAEWAVVFDEEDDWLRQR